MAGVAAQGFSTSPDCPLDLAYLARQTFGDVELEREVLGLFVGQCDRLTPVICAGDDQSKRSDAAHTLKGAARAVGAFALAAAAEDGERSLARSGDLRGQLGERLEQAAAAAREAALRRIAGQDS